MRGRRAFVILSVYLVLLAGFAWMVELIMERTYSTGFGGNSTYASAAIGQGIFAGLLMLETLLVAFLAPMATAGSISLEREKQTLEMLAATPITSLAIVLGKLLSALIYVWLLIAASIPLTAVVFVFGGVAPDDLLHGYLVLVVTALGFGSFGLLCSSLVKRTQAATAITIFGVLAISMGSLFVIFFWQALATGDPTGGRARSGPRTPARWPTSIRSLPRPMWLRPTSCCATDSSLALLLPLPVDLPAGPGRHRVRRCGRRAIGVPGSRSSATTRATTWAAGSSSRLTRRWPGTAVVPQFQAPDTAIWPKTVIAWLILSAVFLVLSVQFVSPTRRWRLRRGARRQRVSD